MAILIAFPQVVTAFLEGEIAIDPDIEIIVPGTGDDNGLTTPPVIDLSQPPEIDTE